MKELTCLLLKGLKGKERTMMSNQIANSKPLLIRLEELLQQETIKSDEVKLSDFDNPNWAYKRAWLDGYKKGLTRTLEYVKIKE